EALRPGGARANADLRRAIGVRGAHEGARLSQPRRRDLDARTVAVCTLDEIVEHRIGEGFPPLAARLRLGGRPPRPTAGALPDGRRRLRKFLGLDLRQRRRTGCKQRDHEKQGQTPFSAGKYGFSLHFQTSCLFTGEAGLACTPPPAKAAGWREASPWCLSGRLPLRARSRT